MAQAFTQPSDGNPSTVRRLKEKELSPAQRKQLSHLIADLRTAQVAFEAAQKTLEMANVHAEGFVVYCAEEIGIAVGRDGWSFSQSDFRFVQVEQERENS